MASEARRIRGEAQKNIVKAFESLCGRHSRWEVWSDWITICAVAISNTFDQVHKDEREKLYFTLQKKYTDAEMKTMSAMYAMVVEALDYNPNQDLLGNLFMNLELSNAHNGQFFTPYSLCQLTAGINAENAKEGIQGKSWISVSDPACGAGALLVAFANECMRQKINYQTSVLFVAQDIDFTVGMMCYIQLSLLGCAGYVVIGDTLAHPATAIDKRGLIPTDNGNVWYTPMYFMDVWNWRKLGAKLDMTFNNGQPREVQAVPSASKEPEKLIPKERKSKKPQKESDSEQLVLNLRFL